MPISNFTTELEVENLTETAIERLGDANVGSINLHTVVSEIFAELAINAVQHSESEIGGFGLIQFYGVAASRSRRFICVVADGGIGIRASLERNPLIRD